MALTERLAVLLDVVGGDRAANDLRKVGAASDRMGASTGLAGGRLDQLAAKAGLSGAALRTGLAAGAVAAGAAVVGFGVKAVGAFTDLGAAVLQFQRLSGATAEQSSALVAAMDDLNVPAEVGGKAIFQLGKRLETSQAQLAGFGITAVRGADGNTDLAETLLNVADAYVRTGDPARRAALLTAAFGKSGAELIPLLEQGRAGIEALYEGAKSTGQILSQDDIRKAEALRLAQDALSDSVGELSLAIGKGLVPVLTDLAVATTTVVDAFGKLGGAGRGLWDKLADALGPVSDALGDINAFNSDWFLTTGGNADRAADGLGRVGDAGHDAADGLIAADAAADKFQGSILGVVNAERAYQESLRGITSATKAVEDARREYNDLLAEGKYDEEEIADATERYDDALRSVDDALTDVEDKQRALNDALQPATFDEVTEAVDNLTLSLIGLDDAQETLDEKIVDRDKMKAAFDAGTPFIEDPAELRGLQDDVTEKQDRYNEVISDPKSSFRERQKAYDDLIESQGTLTDYLEDAIVTADELEDADNDVTRAQIAVHGANRDVTRSEGDLQSVRQKGTELDPEVIQARKDLATATEGWADATDNATGAHNDLLTALAGDPDWDEKVKDAYANVTDAGWRLHDAQWNAAQQAINLKDRQNELEAQLYESGAAAEYLKQKLESLPPSVQAFLKPVFDEIAGVIGRIEFLPTSAGGAGPLPGFKMIATPAAEGGIFMPKPGGHLVNLAEAGQAEAVIPLDRFPMGGGGDSLTVHVHVAGSVISERDLTQTVYAELLKLQRRNASLGLR